MCVGGFCVFYYISNNVSIISFNVYNMLHVWEVCAGMNTMFYSCNDKLYSLTDYVHAFVHS